jgi:hypothetical protein
MGICGATSQAQVTAVNSRLVRPRIGLGTLSVAALPSAVNFTLVPGGVANGQSTVAITTTWSGLALISSATLSAYFMIPAQALSGGTPVAYIPSSCIFGKVPTGIPTTFTAFTGTAPLGSPGGGLQLFSQSSILSLGWSRIDTLSFQINLTSLPQLPAATYTGVLILQAQAF